MRHGLALALVLPLAFGTIAAAAGCRQPPLPQGESADRDLAAGRHIFERKCARCHDRSGRGRPSVIERFPFANLVDGAWRTGGSAPAIERQIRTGHNPMPGFEGRLTEEEIQQTVAYVLSLPRRAEAGGIARPPGR